MSILHVKHLKLAIDVLNLKNWLLKFERASWLCWKPFVQLAERKKLTVFGQPWGTHKCTHRPKIDKVDWSKQENKIFIDQ